MFDEIRRSLRSKNQVILEELNRQKHVGEDRIPSDMDADAQETQYLLRKYQRKRTREHWV